MAALYKLRKHQLRSVAKFDKLSGYLDLSAPGTGKTAVTATIFAKRHSYKKKAMLVFAPKTLLRSAWYDDIKKFTPHLKAVICPAEKRAAAFAEKADVYITNHDAVNWVAKQGKDFFKRFIMLTIDEGSAFKHHTSQRSKAMNRIKKHFETRALLSATLNANTIADIWHPVNLVDDGKRLGHSFFAFRNTVCQPEQVGRQTHMVKWHDKEGAEDAVFAALEDISMRHELSGIPENIVYTLPYYMPDRQLITYREMEATQLASIVPLKDRAKAVAARLRGERIDYTTVTAINAAAVTTKLLQIACLAEGTDVLTDSGWKPIENITVLDRVWDGEAWVFSKGASLSGRSKVIDCDGVYMTLDHNVLTNSGWATAQEIVDGYADGRLDRAPVRLPGGITTSGEERSQEHSLAHALRLRGGGNQDRLESQERKSAVSEVMWLQEGRTATGLRRNASAIEHADVSPLDRHQRPLLQPIRQGLRELWRTWDHGLQTVARFVRGISSGYGAFVPAGIDHRPAQQQSRLFQSKLPVGYANRTRQQHPIQHPYRDAERLDDCDRGSSRLRSKVDHDSRTDGARRHQSIATSEEVNVYDIIDVEPRHCFTVRGNDGKIFIAHNSGAVYQNPDTYHLIDTGRYEFILELVEDRKHPLVFFLWKHQRDFLVQQAEKKNLRFCVLDGEATARERNDMVAAYQNGLYDVMFAHPASAAHGLTLTRGTSIIWASPTYNAEWFEQGNRRQYRIGQAEKTEVITVIAPGTIEPKVYAKMEAKQLRMGNLNDLFAEAQAA